MRIIDVIRISASNISGNKMRSALTILGISVGIATIVFLVSLGYGLQDLSLKRIASIEAVNTLNVSAGKAAAPDEKFAEKYKQDSRVEKVVVANSTPIQATYNGKALDGVASIVPADFFGLEGIKPESGDFYREEDKESLVVSSGFVKGYDMPSANLIGQNVTVKIFAKKQSGTVETIEKNLKVMGVFVDDSTVLAYVSADLSSIVTGLPINQVKVKVAKRDDIKPVKDEIENAGYTVTSVADTIGQLDSIFKAVQIILAIFGGVALVVASIGMFNTMTIALLERTRDVGIMKATGTDDSRIYLIFLSEAVLISGTGGLFGLFLGWVSSELINLGINALAKSVGGEVVDLFSVPIPFVALMLGFSLLVGISTGFLPARRASKLNPLEALRYE